MDPAHAPSLGRDGAIFAHTLPQVRKSKNPTPSHRRPERFAYRLWNNARQRARRNGREFTITLEWLQDQLNNDPRCAVTNLPLTIIFTDETHSNPWQPSLDRIDATLGYTPENTQIVCWAYNAAKNQWGDSVVSTLAKALVANDY